MFDGQDAEEKESDDSVYAVYQIAAARFSRNGKTG
jgi:hypothetical protein